MDYMVIVICICSGLHFVTSQLATNATAESGTNQVISCSLSGVFTFPEWRGPPSLMVYTTQGSAFFNPTLSNFDRLQYASNNRDLIIKNVQKSDVGEYRCSSAGLGDYSVTLFISILTSSGMQFVTSLLATNATAESAKNQIISCPLSGTFTLPEWRGPPSLTIYAVQGSATFNPALSNLDRLQYASNNRDLIIKNVQKSDEGEYKCSVPGTGDYSVTLSVIFIIVIIYLVFLWLGLCIGGVILCSVALIATVIFIKLGRKGKIVIWNLGKWDVVVLILGLVTFVYSLIVGALTVSKNEDCRKCTMCDMNDCDNIFGLGVACIVIACIDLVVMIVLIIIRQDKPKQQNETVNDEASKSVMMKEQILQQEKTAV